jgi:hypothetical protein
MQAEARRLFTQIIAAAGTLSIDEAEKQLRAIDQHIHIQKAIQVANQKLLPLDLEIAIVISEVDGLKYVTMINTRADEAATKFGYLESETEVKYFKMLVKKLLDANGEISRNNAIALRSSVTKMTDVMARKLLDTAIAQGMLQEGEKGETIYIGPKLQAELRPVLVEMAESLSSCKVCGELCIRSLTCESCRDFHVHRHCGDVIRACRDCGKALV